MILFNRKSIRICSFIMIFVFVLSPFCSVLANVNWQSNEEKQEESFFESIGNALDYLQMDFFKILPHYQLRSLRNIFGFKERDRIPTGDLVETELAKALQALNNFGSAVLKDERLVNALEEIISDLTDKDDFTGGIQKRKVFFSEIIRDKRLINILGEVIADYLKDEKMAEDIEMFFTIGLDLIADKNVQAYIKETIARLVENPKTLELLNGIIAAVAQIIYNTATETIADITSDGRIKEIIKDITSIFLNPIPGMVADIVEDERIKNASEEILLLLLKFGPDITADILEDEAFQSLIEDIIVTAINFSVESTTSFMRDENLAKVIFGVTENISDAVGTGTITNIVTTMIDDLFKSDEFRAFVDPGFEYIISESRQRARDNTYDDSYYVPSFELDLNLGKEIAWGIAEVPPEIIYLGFFQWLVYGKDDLDARTYSEWAAQFTSIISSDFVKDIGKALVLVVGQEVPRLVDENKHLLFEDLKEIIKDIPYDDAVNFFREDEKMNNFPAIIAETVISYIPFDYLAGIIREDNELIKIINEVTGELINEFPLEEVGEFIKDDPRIKSLFDDALPDLPLNEIADFIRNDELFWSLITDIAKTLPVTPISQFLQGGLRADIIGYTLSDLILNLLADVVENPRMTDFFHTVLTDIMGSFDDPFAKVILDSLARFFENEELSPFLAASLVGAIKETEIELHRLYKEIVPRFFTRFITGN